MDGYTNPPDAEAKVAAWGHQRAKIERSGNLDPLAGGALGGLSSNMAWQIAEDCFNAGYEAGGSDTLIAAQLGQRISQLTRLLERSWSFPSYPGPGEGMVSEPEDWARQEQWRQDYAVLDAEITAALGEQP